MNDRVLKNVCVFITAFAVFVALRIILVDWFFLNLRGNNKFYLGICLPFCFGISNRELRASVITLVLITIVESKSWLSVGCVLTSVITIYWNKWKLLILPIALLCILGSFTLKSRYGTPIDDLSTRLSYYKLTIDQWKNRAWGHGLGSFKELPVNQPERRHDKLWLHTSHSDLLQGLFELGFWRMFFISFLLVLPVCFLNLSLFGDRILLASFISIALQSVFDFPWHRSISLCLCLIVVSLCWRRFLCNKV